ncbi:mandelate racemase/muconate lactonizing protein-like protein [Zalerion maritima]|uniref:Mandelate racemase/muconate lactonizing protein-like protein n=1 Tax=Zalerion maritima TaxID=339359 RepID=A0AAD5WWE8_9PEZI|nr:mandelate racemase/muconate lactonizing protein-like protein [Zalerion maritima]
MGKIATIEYFRVPPRWLFVKVTDEEGNFGWGEATLEGHTEATEGALDAMKLSLKGMEAENIEHIWQFVYRNNFYRGGCVLMSALAGIDIALWDLKAKRLGVPIYQLLGGKVRNRIKVYSWIGGDRPSDIKEQALIRKSQGFTAIKMNGTADLEWLASPSDLNSAVERLAAVKSVGLDAGIDYHGRVHLPNAVQLARLMEPHQPLFIEEPLLPGQVKETRDLRMRTIIPVALGERLYHRTDVRPYLEQGAVDLLQPDVSHVGGITELMKIASLAETYDVPCAPHCPLGPIAFAASVQADTAMPNFAIQEMSLGIHYNADSEDLTSYIKNPEAWRVRDGYVDILEKPGLGIEVDEDMVRKMSKKYEKERPWTTPGFVSAEGEIREW